MTGRFRQALLEKGTMPKKFSVKSGDKSAAGGLTAKGVKRYRAANPGSKLKTAVTTKPSKLKKGSKAANRRKSFCARMGGMKKSRTSAKTANDPNSRINKALRKWNCSTDIVRGARMALAEACWKGYKARGMKKKGNRMVPNCVKENDSAFSNLPNEEDINKSSNPVKKAIQKRPPQQKNKPGKGRKLKKGQKPENHGTRKEAMGSSTEGIAQRANTGKMVRFVDARKKKAKKAEDEGKFGKAEPLSSINRRGGTNKSKRIQRLRAKKFKKLDNLDPRT